MTQTTAPVEPTTDLEQAQTDLDEHGYCLVAEVLDAERVAEVKGRLVDLAVHEIEEGTDYVYEDGANQRVWTLLNKGDCFVDLVFDGTVWALTEHLLDPGFLLSNIDANIAGPGGKPMFLHADQSFCPAPWPPYALVSNAMWMLDDFTAENGATRVTPGSHQRQEHPPLTISDQHTVPVTGPAGTVMVFDGRLWHQTGANVTDDQRRHGILAYYCRPFMRQQENWFLSIDPEVLERHGGRLRKLLGYEHYFSLGMIDGMPRKGPRY